MKKTVLLSVIVLSMIFGTISPLHAQIKDGDWVGRVIHLTGSYMDVVYKVRNEDGAVNITMDVEGYGGFKFDNIRVGPDSLSFTWNTSFQLYCALHLLDDGVYQGACIDPWGGFGGIIMAPPGSDVDAIEIDDATVESIAGWTPPEEEIDFSLGDAYPVGQAIDVGGYRLNVVDVGSGDVTVILEAGLGDNLSTWEAVQKRVGQVTRVVAYDRAGLGYSEPSPSRRTPEQIATELHALLRGAKVPPPYVLVGHAEGGLYVRRFASLYPGEVVGLVLVDPSHEEQGTRWQALSEASWEDYLTKRNAFFKIMPAPVQGEYQAYARILEEKDVPGLGSLPDIPTVVMTAMRSAENPQWIGETAEGRAAWRTLHGEWVDQARNATHIVTEKSGSYIHLEQPSLVFNAIQQVIGAVQEQ